MPPVLSQRAYARHRKVSHTAVQRAIQSGRLIESLVPMPSGRVKVDQELADEEWGQHTHPAQQREKNPGPARLTQTTIPGTAEPEEPPPPEANGSSQVTMMAIRNAQAARLTYQAKLAKQQFEVRTGELVEREVVEREAARVGSTIKHALLMIPDRLAALVAAETDPDRVRELLGQEIRAALEELARARERE